MIPKSSLPIDGSWQSTDEYVESLLTFVSTSELFRNLCGGVHVLDFLTRTPDLYSWVLPKGWRDWFEEVNIEDVLDLLLREDLQQFRAKSGVGAEGLMNGHGTWRGHRPPPETLVEYVNDIRRLSLKRDFTARKPKHDLESLPRHVSVGMKPKKIHEVSQAAAFVDDLSQHLARGCRADTGTLNGEDVEEDGSERSDRPFVIDFGSGQNYLGRTLACAPYKKGVVAIEQRHHNVEGARGMDVSAKLATKQKKLVNKKEWLVQWRATKAHGQPTTPPETVLNVASNGISEAELRDMEARIPLIAEEQSSAVYRPKQLEAVTRKTPATSSDTTPTSDPAQPGDEEGNKLDGLDASPAAGTIQYVEKALTSGDLSDILDATSTPSLVVSIHSCGNLTHHGLRSLTLNPSIRAVALIGCCYNLLTERLGPLTYKLPTLRSNHPRLDATSSAFDPHGFPMSKRLEAFRYPIQPSSATEDTNHSSELEAAKARRYHNLNGNMQEVDMTGRGVRLNITARMMAVQAPHNWGPKDSEDFFTRHYYRALLQRILLDVGVVKMSTPAATPDIEIAGGTLSGKDEAGSPLIIGSLRKACFASFNAYVHGAIEKLSRDPVDGSAITEKTQCLFDKDGELIAKYEEDYKYAKKQLSIIWSLMAFSANVVESTILVDRWLWLKEQNEVQDAWVEAVFDYKQSPRNMVVVGIKKPDW